MLGGMYCLVYARVFVYLWLLQVVRPFHQCITWLQVKECTLKEDIYCPPETAVLLGSYAVSSESRCL